MRKIFYVISLASYVLSCQPSQAQIKLISLGSKGIPGIEMYVDLNSRGEIVGGSTGYGYKVYEIYTTTGKSFSQRYGVFCKDQTLMEFENNREPLPAFAKWQVNLLTVVCQDITITKQPRKETGIPKQVIIQNPPLPSSLPQTPTSIPPEVNKPTPVTPEIKTSPIVNSGNTDGNLNELKMQSLRVRLSNRFKIPLSALKDINVKDIMTLQTILQKNGFRVVGSRLSNGKLVRKGDSMELPTLKSLQLIIDDESKILK